MKNSKSLPSLDDLKQHLSYDPETGIFIWKIPTGRRVKAGSVAGAFDAHGYKTISFKGKNYKLHRLAWLFYYEFDPIGFEIDHKDSNRSNNSIVNLRIATRKQNAENRSKLSTNTSGTTGVTWNSRQNKWQAYITNNELYLFLGLFSDKNDAILARKLKEKELFEFKTKD